MKNIADFFRQGATRKLLLFFLLLFSSASAWSIDWERAPDGSWVTVTWFGTPNYDNRIVTNPASAGLRAGDGSLIVLFVDHGFHGYRFDFRGVTCKNNAEFDKVVQSKLTNLHIPESDNTMTMGPGIIYAYCASKTAADSTMDLKSTIRDKVWYFNMDPPVTNSCTLTVGGPYNVTLGEESSTQINASYSIGCTLTTTLSVSFQNRGKVDNFPQGLTGIAKMENGTTTETLKNISSQTKRPFSINLNASADAAPGSYTGTVVVVAAPQ